MRVAIAHIHSNFIVPKLTQFDPKFVTVSALIKISKVELNFAGNNNASGSMIDDKSKQWFGASVHSSGQDGIIVVRNSTLNFSEFSINFRFIFLTNRCVKKS